MIKRREKEAGLSPPLTPRARSPPEAKLPRFNRTSLRFSRGFLCLRTCRLFAASGLNPQVGRFLAPSKIWRDRREQMLSCRKRRSLKIKSSLMYTCSHNTSVLCLRVRLHNGFRPSTKNRLRNSWTERFPSVRRILILGRISWSSPKKIEN
jgi:hypothetical protein